MLTEDVIQVMCDVYDRMDVQMRTDFHFTMFTEHLERNVRSRVGWKGCIDVLDSEDIRYRRRYTVTVPVDEAWCKSLEDFSSIIMEEIQIVFYDNGVECVVSEVDIGISRGDSDIKMPDNRGDCYDYEYEMTQWRWFGRNWYTASFLVDIDRSAVD